MRATEFIAEYNEDYTGYKLWISPSGEVYDMDIHDTHYDFFAKNPHIFGIEADQVQKYEDHPEEIVRDFGWTRVANINDAALAGLPLPEDSGYITAPNVKAARYAAKWLVKNDGEPRIMEIDVIGKPTMKLDAMTDTNLERFAKGKA